MKIGFNPDGDHASQVGGRLSLRAVALIVGAVLFGGLLVGPAATASASTAPTKAKAAPTPDETKLKIRSIPRGHTEPISTEQRISGLLSSNPGAHRVDVNTIKTRQGVLVRIQPNALQGCPTLWLCVNQDANFGGAETQFFNCGDVNLGPLGWNDRISSIRNAQSSGVQSRFYNFDGSGDPNNSSNWRFVLALNSGSYLRDLSKDTSADGGNANDKIDIIHVC